MAIKPNYLDHNQKPIKLDSQENAIIILKTLVANEISKKAVYNMYITYLNMGNDYKQAFDKTVKHIFAKTIKDSK